MSKRDKHIHTESVFQLVQLDDRPLPVDVDLDYDIDDPYAVRMTLAIPGIEPVSWRVGRDLLCEGLRGIAGEGDVRVRTISNDTVLLELKSPDADAWFNVPAGELAEFLDDTYAAVPMYLESEWIDMDDALHALLTEAAEQTRLGRTDRT